MKFSTISLAAALLLAGAEAGSKSDWKSRTVYQVLTDRFARSSDGGSCSNLSNYCGGTWKGIQNHLDYIQGMGFNAIWISPVIENLDNGYHGYWATNWEKVNEHFGTSDDLKALVSAAHSKGIWVMVDVVANHVGPVGDDFSKIYPLNQASHYHSDCEISDWSNQSQVENCRLSGLPDLAQENSYVRSYLKNWVKDLVQKFNFDGIRIDTIPEVPKDFWGEYTQSAGVFQMGECFNGDPNYVGPYQKYVEGLFNYPMYYTIRDIWSYSKSMYEIRTRYQAEASAFQDIDALGVFVDNHDNARFLNSQKNTNMFKNAIAFSLTSRGIPFFYYGDEQGFAGGNDPNNREILFNSMNTQSDLYQFVQKVNAARNKYQIWNQSLVERYVDDNFYAFSRGKFLVALTNTQNEIQRKVTYQPFDEGETVCNIFYPTTDCLKVTGGALEVTLLSGETKIFVPQESMLYFLQQ